MLQGISRLSGVAGFPACCRRMMRLTASALGLALVVGCSTSKVDREGATAPPPATGRAIVGAIDSGRPEWQRLARRFRGDLADALAESGQFVTVTDRTAEPPAPRDLVISGAFVEIDPGSETARGILGLGSGKPTIKAWFQVTDVSGQVLLHFEQEARPRGGSGFDAHWAPLILDDEIRVFAADAAGTVVDWLESPPHR